MNTIKVKNHTHLVRDSKTKAILNADIIGLRKRNEKISSTVTLETLTQEVNVIKNDFQEIKSLLRQIVAKR